jgi:hypothetical protein
MKELIAGRYPEILDWRLFQIEGNVDPIDCHDFPLRLSDHAHSSLKFINNFYYHKSQNKKSPIFGA